MIERKQIADFSLEQISLLSGVEYSRPDNTPLLMDLIFDMRAPRPMPVVIWLHGGGFTEEQMTRLSRPEHRFVELARKGYLIASIDYRLAQTSPFPAQLQDSKCAVRFLRSHAGLFGIDPDRMAVWGESCGGQLAALMAVKEGIPALEDAREWTDVSDEIQAAVAWYGGFNIPKFTGMLKDPRFAIIYGGTFEEKRELVTIASPITYAAKRLCPILSMCSDTDVRVPYAQSVEFCQAAASHGNDARHVTVPGQGHGYFEGESYDRTVYAFLDEHLMRS